MRLGNKNKSNSVSVYHQEFYDRVITGLKKASSKTDLNLQFNSRFFLEDIWELIKSLDSQKFDQFFKYDLGRLVVKWFVHMDQEFRDDFVKEIVSQNSFYYKELKKLFDMDFLPTFQDLDGLYESAYYFNDIEIRDLFYAEFLERDDIHSTFDKAVRIIYHNEKGNCQMMKNECFKGDYRNDAILRFDPNGEVIKCFFNPKHPVTKTLVHATSDSRKSNPYDYRYISNKILSSYQNGGNFIHPEIHGYDDFLKFLQGIKKLKDGGNLKYDGSILKKIIGFSPIEKMIQEIDNYFKELESKDVKFYNEIQKILG